jgi:hypothetical protein
MAKLRQVSREPLWLMSVGQGAIVRAEITRWRLPHDLVRRPGRTFSIIRPGHLQREPSGVVERHRSGNPATSLGRRQFKFDVYL